MRPLPALLSLVVLSTPSLAQIRWYVDDDAAPGGNGQSWATAFQSLDDALSIAGRKEQIWVAEGEYVPTVRKDATDPRSVTFQVPEGCKVYGGFAGNETSLQQRAGLFEQTHLNGDVGVPGDRSDNAYHVVFVYNPFGPPPGGTHLDGFRVSGGNALGEPNVAFPRGGGVHAFNVAMVIANCTIEDNMANDGGAVIAQPGLLEMRFCTLRGNRAANNGGALWSQATTLRIFSCTFSGNVAANRGGGVYLHSNVKDSELTLFANDVFRDNVAAEGGGAFIGGASFTSGAGTFRNCTFGYNRAIVSGGGIRAVTTTVQPARVQVHDSILWGNQSPTGPGIHGRALVTYSNLQDGTNGLFGNFSADPGFVDVALRDLRLAPGSPCIDRGSNFVVAEDRADVDLDGDLDEPVPLDLSGGPRFLDDPATPDMGQGSAPIVDVGAYEF